MRSISFLLLPSFASVFGLEAELPAMTFPSGAWERENKLCFGDPARKQSNDVPKQSLGTRKNWIPAFVRHKTGGLTGMTIDTERNK